MKLHWQPGTMIYPLPAALISVGATPDEYNLFTVSWLGTICSDPAMCYISVRPSRHSYSILKKNMEYVINLTTEEMARAADWCGVRSGKDYNKFDEMQLTPVPSKYVAAPLVDESPISIECRVKEVIALGTHDMFISEVISVAVDDRFLDAESGKFDLQKAKLIAYSHGQYYKLGNEIGHFGWSVKKK